MTLLKFILIIFGIYIAFFLFIRLFGKSLSRFVLKYLVRKAQQDMERQSRVYEQKAEGYSPFEESMYMKDDVKVSMRRGQKEQSRKSDVLDPNRIEEVDFEDVE